MTIEIGSAISILRFTPASK